MSLLPRHTQLSPIILSQVRLFSDYWPYCILFTKRCGPYSRSQFSLCLLSLCISRVNLTIWKNVHICCDFRMFLILFCSAIQLITLHVYESIKYSPGECKKILIWISTWCNITLLFGGLWIISSLFVKCIIKVGLFCEEAEGKPPSEPRRRSRDSVLKKVRKLKGFSAL